MCQWNFAISITAKITNLCLEISFTIFFFFFHHGTSFGLARCFHVLDKEKGGPVTAFGDHILVPISEFLHFADRPSQNKKYSNFLEILWTPACCRKTGKDNVKFLERGKRTVKMCPLFSKICCSEEGQTFRVSGTMKGHFFMFLDSTVETQNKMVFLLSTLYLCKGLPRETW